MRIAVDIGGTFTDIAITSEDAVAWTLKVLTTPDDPLRAIRTGLDLGLELMAQKNATSNGANEVVFVHATTLAANLVLEGKGVPVTLLTTKGFADTLELGDEARFDIYDLDITYPDPPVKRADVIEIDERTDYKGEILKGIDDAELKAVLQKGVNNSVAVAFLHSYRNPQNEQRVATILKEHDPDIYVSLSSEIAPEVRELPRTMTAVVNAYVKPMVRPYLSRLEEMLAEVLGGSVSTYIMMSNGGLAPPQTIAEYPVKMVESSPAGGALATHHFLATASSRLPSGKRAISLDMGGTTAKVAFLDADEPLALRSQLEVARHYQLKPGSGFPLLAPSVDLIEIGAGGGSLARVNTFGLLEVGPESAGSAPGPAAYGRGGTEPTVTDADVVLGYIPDWQKLGGREAIRSDLARAAVGSLGEKLNMQPEATAAAIHDIANEHMAAAIRVSAAERGVQTEEYALVAFGGAAPLHACGVAERVGISSVIIPPEPGVFSAIGLSRAAMAMEAVRTRRTSVPIENASEVEQLFSDMEAELRERLGLDAGEEVTTLRTADMRFVGQGREIPVALPERPLTEAGAEDDLLANYQREYTRLFERFPRTAIEVINWRLRLVATSPEIRMQQVSGASAAADVPERTSTFFSDRQGNPAEHKAAVIGRFNLTPGDSGDGPALILEDHTCTVVPPNWDWTAGPDGEVVVRRQGN